MSHLNYRLLLIASGAWRRRYVIFWPMLMFPILALVLSIHSQKNYHAYTSMLIQETAKLNPLLEDLAVSARLKERMGALTTLLHSRYILGAVATDMALVDETTTPVQHDEIIAQLSYALSVKMLGKDLIRIDYQSSQPETVKPTLESITNQFIELLIAPERSSIADSRVFLAEHLQQRQQEFTNAELAVSTYQDKYTIELPEVHLTNIARLASMQQSLVDREAALAGVLQNLQGLDEQLAKTNPALSRLEDHIASLQGQLALLKAKYTDQHSAVLVAKQELKRLVQKRQQILSQRAASLTMEQLWAIAGIGQEDDNQTNQPLLLAQLEALQNNKNKVARYQEEISSLKNMITNLTKQVANYSASSRQLAKLERELDIKQELYNDMLLRYEKARITDSVGVFEHDKRVKIIDHPFTPVLPDNPSWLIFVICGWLGGILLGSGIAIALEISDTRLRYRKQIIALTGIPVFSRIPHITSQHQSDSGGK